MVGAGAVVVRAVPPNAIVAGNPARIVGYVDAGKGERSAPASCPREVSRRMWGIQYRYTRDAVLLVFASEYYDGADYIRDYGEFLVEVRSAGRG